ncbi:MFS transporter [Roseovarius sp. D0-M9]|uniref:MFS transporter n=1 Tax=Roseovarius sp. D0-M9 TaxID=3127117 RepID=UPI0030100B08
MTVPRASSSPRAIHLAGVLILFGAAYFTSMFFRTVNAILSTQLSVDLGLDAAALGLMTAAYFLGLGLAQIPIGICLDAYGPRRVQAAMLCVATVGIALFGLTESVPLLVVARAMIGVGMAGCLMTAFQVSMLWLTSEKVPLANGLYLAVGGLGALAATSPVTFLLQFMTWQQMFLMIAVFTLGIAAAIALVTPEQPSTPGLPWGARLRSVGVVAQNQRLLRYLPMTALCFATGTAMQGLWAATWMQSVTGLDAPVIGWTLAIMAVSLTVGSAVGGVLTVAMERRGLELKHVILASTCLFILAEIGLGLFPSEAGVLLWVLFALTYNVVTLSYTHVARSQPRDCIGSSTALMNTAVILSTFVVQYGLGLFLSWSGEDNTAFALISALWALTGLQVAALIWCCFPRG